MEAKIVVVDESLIRFSDGAISFFTVGRSDSDIIFLVGLLRTQSSDSIRVGRSRSIEIDRQKVTASIDHDGLCANQSSIDRRSIEVDNQ